MTTDVGNLKRKRTRERTTVTKLCTAVEEFTDETNLDEFILHYDRLQETLDKLTALDDEIHDQLTDAEYEADIVSCDQYIDNAKRGIYKCKKRIDETLVTSTASLKLQQPPPTTPPPVHNLKLPPVKLGPFRGDVQKWMRFWEQFESCIDQDPYLSTINKHVFLRGYLEDEPKLLVDGIPVTAATYEKTKNIVKERYGDVNRIVQVHLDLLENIRPLVSASPEELNTLYIECNRHVHALTALGEDVNAYGRVLSTKILRAFPSAVCQRWLLHAKHHNLSEANILELMKFIGNEVDTSLTAQKIRCEHSEFMPTAAALHVRAAPRPSRPSKSYSKGNTINKPYCVFCNQKDHWAQDCFVVKNVTDRIQKLKTANRCFLCLNRGHNRLSCRKRRYVSCSKCKGDHHKSICLNNNPSRVEREDPPPVATAAKTSTVGRIDIVSPSFVYLQTARVWVTGPTGIRKLTRCVLDCGSQSSFVSDSLIDELQLNVINTQNLTVNSFENAAVLHPRRLVKVSVTSFWSHSSVQITAFESSHSFSAHPTTPNDLSIFGSARKLKLADPTDNSCDLPIQLLIGGDFYWKVVNDRSPLRLSDSIVLLSSKFGWILSGARSGVVSNMINVNYIHMDETPPDKDMRRFWDLETMGIDAKQPRCMSSSESTTLEQFYASYQTQNGRRVVSLPKKGNFDALSSNQLVAKNRFYSLEKRLATDTCLREAYHEQMICYISKGQVEPVLCNSSSTAHYLPHHIVKKRRCDTVKYRVVFDASSHEINCPSLNDCLEAGPNLVPDSVAILLRFRLWPIALTGDVVQAFLQLELHPDDRDLTRFFWYQVIGKDDTYSTTNEIGTYRFTRLPFGLTCSPFLLAATIKELTLTYKDQYPSVTRLLENNMYVDDFASGADNDDNAISLYYDLITLMKKISFPMSKWATNSQVLKDIWCAEGQEDFVYTKVLGVNWNTMSDYLYTENHLDIKDIIAVPVTKRQLLRATAAFYDPLGLFSPVSIVGKILFQETWCRGISWDELLPQDLGTQWNAWTSTLPCLADVHVPRYVGHMNENSEIHIFCDASERAYGAVLYLRHLVDDKFIVNLVCSKNRLSPVKKVTLPRLELLAALVGARLLHYFCKETGNAAEKATLWTDSMVVLGWVQNNANLWKTFVCNRVTEIQNYTSPSQWKHCPGVDNPADHLSRGVTPSKLVTLKTWWHGPAWLSQQSDDFPSSTISTDLQLPEKKPVAVPVYVVVSGEPLINSSDFSSYWKLLRMTAWVLRFVNCLLKRIKSSGELTATELHASRNFWIHSVQKDCFSAEINALQNNLPLPSDSSIARYNPFLDDDEFIRLGGRLQFADLSKNEKHPILLDGKHHFTDLLICSTHVRLHHLGTRIVLSELRAEFWITRARQAIKRVIYHCLPCKIAKGHFAQQIEAPLPADRVTPRKVFAITGIDFAGPVFIKTEAAMQKSYIVLFTCASIRAIHLELCTNMSTDCFLLAFERFVGRRGLPHTVYTDNARSFHAANDSLQELWITFTASRTHSYFAEHGITWKFIAPRAAWWGGWWERMIGTTKHCLRKVLGKSRVSAENFSTLLVSIEAAINSRPLVPDEEGLEALTPAHFLVGDKLTTLPSGLEPNPNVNLTKEFKIQNQITDEFWKRWSKEYLLTLKSFHEVRQPKGLLAKLKIGDIVLVQEDSRPRQMWNRARIEDLLEGRDGRVRTVLLHTPEGKRITRPVQLVIPLEIDQVLENIDSELKARAVMRRPVIYTKFMMDLMTNALVNCISASPCLTSVELEGLPLNLNYISLISNAFKKCPSVQNISFHGSCIGDDGCREVCQSIKDLLNIITLDFTNCGITEEGACHIAELIEYQRVQRLSESWKYSLRQQQPNMDGMSGLRRITLNRNVKIGRNGIICIVEVLMDDFWVKAIDFQDCGADEEVASYVLKLLDMNKVLSVIDLRGNKHISDKSLTYVMEKLNYNNKGVKFNWISLSEPSPTKKAHAQMAREICISESSPKVSAYKMRPKSATVRSARNISDMLGQRKSVTDVNKSPQQKSFNLSSPRSVSDTRLGELLKPIGKLCIRREDITPGMPRSLQQQEKRHCVWRSQSPPTVAPPPPTPELSSLHNTSSDIEEQILQMSKEQVVCIVREMAKERQASFQEIARLTAENRKLQAHLDKYHREMEKITLNTSGKVLVDETVMVNLQNIVEKVFETRNSERFFEQKETHLHGREFSNLITLPNNGFKLPDRSLKYNCDFSNTYPTCDESKDTTEYVTVSCNEECYERNLGVTDAEVVKYSMLLRCLTKEVTQMKVGDILENINCDITEGRDCQQLFELETNNYKSKQSELIYCAESCTSSLSGSPSGCDNTNSRYTPSSVSESVSSLGSSFLTC